MDIDSLINSQDLKKYRGLPFWAWNGKLEKTELIRQINEFKRMGFGGFFMHSRTGLKTEYLGNEWFELIRICAKEAARLGLKAYLYDEDRWPSGTCGGLVTKNPEYRLCYISMYEHIPQEVKMNSNFSVLASFDIALDSGLLHDYKLIDSSVTCEELSYNDMLEHKTIHFVVEEMKSESFYNGYTYVDTLNSNATNCFLELTHNKYKEKLGDMIGKEIAGIFVDEPHRGCTFGGFTVKNSNAENMIPYTKELFPCFKNKKGYDLLLKLPELYFRYKNQDYSYVSYDYIDVLQDMFLDNFAKPYHDWCKKNNMILTGHILHEDNLTSQVAMSGSVMRYYEFMDYPGVDILTKDNKCFWVAKQVASVAKQLEKPFVLSELYGCTGWQLNFEEHKQIGDWQAFLGINLRCHHLSMYTLQGQAKRDFPASISFQSGWYDKYSNIEDYFTRLAYLQSEFESVTDTLVITPVESMWGYVQKGCFKDLTCINDNMQRLENVYAQTFITLTNQGIDFDYADEGILLKHSKVDKNQLRVGKMKYKTVVVSGLDNIRQSTYNLLKKFINNGGNVIVYNKPKLIDSKIEFLDFAGAIYVKSLAECAKECKENSNIKLQISKDNFIVNMKKINDGYLLFVLNTDRQNDCLDVQISVNLDCGVQELDLHLCKISDTYSFSNEDELTIVSNYAKGQERIFILSKNKDLINVENFNTDIDSTDFIEKRIIKTEFDYNLSEPNVLVLDRAKAYINGEFFCNDDILNIDIALRKRLGLDLRDGYDIQPWFKEKFLSQENKKQCGLTLEYEFYVNKKCDDILFVVERPEILAMFLNGAAINNEVSGTFIDNSFKTIALDSKKIKTGKNIITIVLDFYDNVDLEACYLIGEFGVYLKDDNSYIGALPKKINRKPLCEQGLPFYSGKITINFKPKEGDLKLKFDSIKCAYVEAKFNSNKEISNTEFMYSSPYMSNIQNVTGDIELTYCLTRRNTLGPLHLSNTIQRVYRPQSFIPQIQGYNFYDERLTIPLLLYKKQEN